MSFQLKGFNAEDEGNIANGAKSSRQSKNEPIVVQMCCTRVIKMYFNKNENMKSVSVSELRENLKEILEDVKSGNSIQITQRGNLIAVLQSQLSNEDENLYLERMKTYKNGGIQIVDDIVHQPLKQYDFAEESDNSWSIASDIDENE